MKRKFISVISILVVALLSACGPAATPAMSVADAQGTAMADAWLAITQTQAAIPTATETPIPPPPTETPLPSPTLALIPTVSLPAVTATPEVDICDGPPPVSPVGKMVKVKFVNKTNSSLNLSFAMDRANEENECGTYSFSLSKFDEPVVDVMAGCYWAWAWVEAQGDVPSSNARSLEALCVTDPSKAPAIWIAAEVINFH